MAGESSSQEEGREKAGRKRSRSRKTGVGADEKENQKWPGEGSSQEEAREKSVGRKRSRSRKAGAGAGNSEVAGEGTRGGQRAEKSQTERRVGAESQAGSE